MVHWVINCKEWDGYGKPPANMQGDRPGMFMVNKTWSLAPSPETPQGQGAVAQGEGASGGFASAGVRTQSDSQPKPSGPTTPFPGPTIRGFIPTDSPHFAPPPQRRKPPHTRTTLSGALRKPIECISANTKRITANAHIRGNGGYPMWGELPEYLPLPDARQYGTAKIPVLSTPEYMQRGNQNHPGSEAINGDMANRGGEPNWTNATHTSMQAKVHTN